MAPAGKLKRLTYVTVAGMFLALVGVASSVQADTISDKLTISADSTPVALENVTLSSSADFVGAATQLQVRFTTPNLDFPFDYRVGVTFPDAFGFDSAVTATFSDDSPAPDPEIQAVEIIDHTVIFTCRRTFFAPKAGQTGIIDINGVTLPTLAANFSATVFISDIDFVVLAGPTFTNEITLAPDVATAISLSPAADTGVVAGDLLMFTANSVDKYGNPVSDSALNWSFTANSDSLGELTPGNLIATKSGSGRIVVSSSLSADTSGLITVRAAALARLEIEMRRQQYEGGVICGASVVRAFDRFDNPKSTFSASDSILELSVTEGHISPATISTSAFNSAGELDLGDAGVTFSGFTGELELTAGIGTIISAPHPVSISGVTIKPIYGSVFPDFIGGAEPPKEITLPIATQISTSFRIAVEGSAPVSIDSVVVVLPDSQVLVFSDNVQNTQELTPGAFVSPSIPTPSANDTLVVTVYGIPQIVQSIDEPLCSIVSRITLPVKYVDERLALSDKVETLLDRSKYTLYPGFDIGAPYTANILLSGELFINDLTDTENGDLFRFGSYAVGSAGFDLVAVNPPPVEITPIPSALGAGMHQVTAIATLSDGIFSFTDTSAAEPRLSLIEAARFAASGADLTPSGAGPGDTVTFALPLTISGAFDDSAVVSPQLQLYNSDTVITVQMGLSAFRDTVFSVAPLRLPVEFAQTQWGARLVTHVVERMSERDDTLDLGPDVFTVGPLTQISVTSLSVDAPNFPFVSAGQQFDLDVTLVNNAPFAVNGVQVSADSSSAAVGALTADDTVTIAVPYATTEPSQVKTVTVVVTSDNGAREESSAQIQFTVQSPAALRLVGDLNLADGADGKQIAEVGAPLSLQLALLNDGEASISGGSVIVTATGAGLDFSSIVNLEAPTTNVNLGAPSLAGAVRVTATVLDKPQELNTGAGATFVPPGGATFESDITVVDKELLVNANFTVGDTTAVAFGERREMFSAELSNVSALDEADVKVVSFVTLLRGADGASLDPGSVFDVNRSALFDARGKAVAILRVVNDSLFFDMTPNTLPVGERATYRFVAQFVAKSAVRTFSLVVPVSALKLQAVSGPRIGARFTAQTPAGAPPFQSKEYTLTSSVFAESFQPQYNPFNPVSGPTQFSYTLNQDSDVELSIYTLAGKLVRRFNFSAGAQYGSTGVQTPSWDGRNGDGAIVRDGVYVVALTNLTTGEKAYLKQAVLK